ncbi:class I SAM-dependent methyltransferase [Glycomyces niveus]|uniref:Class I SAM-dependent methyltransferase n=1 Tax=Glycomyces niveus TaxID=2820287 RepID=A0ABS3U089_9ACTN|nr:class I SAM-dependent methyltransferase [Glycomyces sp. NEAU-S30]MBO3732190.1 class I SAM-dependent methyltransferase [Glycomyces sp. NEAU-S30]
MQGQTTDERFQKVDNYRSEDGLAARQGLYQYKTPDYDLPGVVVSRVGQQPGRVLDVGCGNGRYTGRLRESFPGAEVIGVDLAEGILAAVPEPTVVADVAELPFEDGSAEVVLAMHMLYHVPDIPAALDELQRVLAPDGVLFVSTLAADDKQEYVPIWQDAAREVLGGEVRMALTSLLERFSLETAESMLAERFETVALHDLPGVIEVPEPGPLMAAFRSEEDFIGLPPGDFERLMGAIEQRLEAHFADHEVLRVTSRSGILECRGAKG